MLQDRIQQLFGGQCLGARRSQQGQAAELGIEFFVARAGAFQHENDHRDAQRDAEQVIKRHAG